MQDLYSDDSNIMNLINEIRNSASITGAMVSHGFSESDWDTRFNSLSVNVKRSILELAKIIDDKVNS